MGKDILLLNDMLKYWFALYCCSALSLGTDMLEIDCHLTKDGRVIVSHDSSLKRVCDSEGHIAEYDFEVNIIIRTCIFKMIFFNFRDKKIYINF